LHEVILCSLEAKYAVETNVTDTKTNNKLSGPRPAMFHPLFRPLAAEMAGGTDLKEIEDEGVKIG